MKRWNDFDVLISNNYVDINVWNNVLKGFVWGVEPRRVNWLNVCFQIIKVLNIALNYLISLLLF